MDSPLPFAFDSIIGSKQSKIFYKRITFYNIQYFLIFFFISETGAISEEWKQGLQKKTKLNSVRDTLFHIEPK